MHDTYGAKWVLRLFYKEGDECPYTSGCSDIRRIPPDEAPPDDPPNYDDDWTLSNMTAKYKSEFIANSDWLRLSFHALKRYPVDHEIATYEQACHDFNLVKTEVERFAGPPCWLNVVAAHGYEGSLDELRARRDSGVTVFLANGKDFAFDDNIHYIERNYYLPQGSKEHEFQTKNDYWIDNTENIPFVSFRYRSSEIS